MIQRRIVDYVTTVNRTNIDKELLKKLKKIAERHSLQYALLWYIYLKSNCTLKELYRVYKHLSEKLFERILYASNYSN